MITRGVGTVMGDVDWTPLIDCQKPKVDFDAYYKSVLKINK